MLCIYFLQVVAKQSGDDCSARTGLLLVYHTLSHNFDYLYMQENERIKLDLQLLEVKYEKEQKVTDTKTHYSHM